MDSTRESKAFERLHRPYASMNWIRFNGSLRPQSAKPYCLAVSQPLAGTPLVNVAKTMCSAEFMSTRNCGASGKPARRVNRTELALGAIIYDKRDPHNATRKPFGAPL